MKRTVAEFVYSLSDGGAESLIKSYCQLIDRSKFNIIVIVMYNIGDTAVSKKLSLLGIPVIYIYPKRSRINRMINKAFGKWYIPQKMKQIIEQYYVSTIHAHTAVLRYLYYSRKLLDNIKLLYTCHSSPDRYFSGRLKDEFNAAKYLIENNKLQMIALHEGMASQINDMFDITDCTVIKNGITIEDYHDETTSKKSYKHKLGIDTDTYVIGHIGRFVPEKNHILLIDVLKRAVSINPNVFLLMVGDGETKKEIEQIIDSNQLSHKVLILDHRNDIPEILHAMDVFVFPSIVEGLGIALIEAQAADLPCIISESIPNAAIVSNKVYRLSLSENLDKWTKVILDQSGIESEKKAFSLEQYDMSREIKKLEALY